MIDTWASQRWIGLAMRQTTWLCSRSPTQPTRATLLSFSKWDDILYKKLWLIIFLLSFVQHSRILDPGDPNVPFVSLIVGIANCNTAAFSSFANPWAFLAPSDGFPRTYSLVDCDSCFQLRVFQAARSRFLARVERRSPAGTAISFRSAANRWPF